MWSALSSLSFSALSAVEVVEMTLAPATLANLRRLVLPSPEHVAGFTGTYLYSKGANTACAFSENGIARLQRPALKSIQSTPGGQGGAWKSSSLYQAQIGWNTNEALLRKCGVFS
ncbi:hypothetical protein HG530_001544 [Fusarium avenaceum]|nr:hypothetical protein HG530_001544 [Fusarium avenaceum]